jgi:predicted CoA-binding protein
MMFTEAITMFSNPTPDEFKHILQSAKTIAVVGLSDNPNRESYAVSQEMQRRGYRVIPINPNVDEVLGEKAYSSLKDIEGTIDIVNVFRRSEALKSVVNEAIETTTPVIWAQQGVYDEEAAEIAKGHGKTMVMDRCIMVMHSLYAKAKG